MKVRPLVFGHDTRLQIKNAVARARAKPTPWAELEQFALKDVGPELKLSDRKKGNQELAHKLSRRSCFVEIPFGYLAAISFEFQPAGLCRHLSVSVSDSAYGRLPSIPAVQMLAEAFGFKMPWTENSRVWIEEFAPQEYALNLLQIEEEGTPT